MEVKPIRRSDWDPSKLPGSFTLEREAMDINRGQIGMFISAIFGCNFEHMYYLSP